MPVSFWEAHLSQEIAVYTSVWPGLVAPDIIPATREAEIARFKV